MERQWGDNGATTSDNGATMERQWSDNGSFPAARAQKDTVTMVEGRVASERDAVLQFAVFVFSSNVFRCGLLQFRFFLFSNLVWFARIHVFAHMRFATCSVFFEKIERRKEKRIRGNNAVTM